MSVYLDHAATTPVRPASAAALVGEFAGGGAGNPSSLHASGRRARRALEEARERIAVALGAGAGQVVLTGGGTEADNLGVKGLYWARRSQDARRRRVLVGAVEHHAVLDAATWLAQEEDADVVWLPVDGAGRLRPDALERALQEDPDAVALVAVMWANNEVGTVQPVSEVAALAGRWGVPVHCDAVQAVGRVPVDFAASGVSTLAVSGHKVGGPVGTGALLVRSGTALTPLVHGGGQEGGLRSGTASAAHAQALAVALEEAVAEQPAAARRLRALREDLVAGIRTAVPDVRVHGPEDADARLPGIALVTVPGCDGDSLLYLLDARGVECSTGSACQAGVPRPSHVLLAMGIGLDDARGALRFSLGWTSTSDDVTAAVAAMGPVVERARRAYLAPAG